jgi:PII-like signaling protein
LVASVESWILSADLPVVEVVDTEEQTKKLDAVLVLVTREKVHVGAEGNR